MADQLHLYGACACERNKYSIAIPPLSASLAQVFFDNSTYSRRTQAAPVAAWLRVPLAWYFSHTQSYMENETHNSIKRTFYTPSTDPNAPPTRRQFCGYCGSHLTQWNESLHGYTSTNADGYLDVTLGSLLSESLDRLEALRILPDLDSSDEESTAGAEGLVPGASINEEDHVLTNETSMSGVDAPRRLSRSPEASRGLLRAVNQPPHNLTNRGIPYFEDMIQHSRLGKIRQKSGGYTSRDGTATVHWEVTELGGEDEDDMTNQPANFSQHNKRPKLDL